MLLACDVHGWMGGRIRRVQPSVFRPDQGRGTFEIRTRRRQVQDLSATQKTGWVHKGNTSAARKSRLKPAATTRQVHMKDSKLPSHAVSRPAPPPSPCDCHSVGGAKRARNDKLYIWGDPDEGILERLALVPLLGLIGCAERAITVTRSGQDQRRGARGAYCRGESRWHGDDQRTVTSTAIRRRRRGAGNSRYADAARCLGARLRPHVGGRLGLEGCR